MMIYGWADDIVSRFFIEENIKFLKKKIQWQPTPLEADLYGM